MGHGAAIDPAEIEVLAPNLKRRLSGVTTTIVQLVPELSRRIGIAVIGPGLPPGLPRVRWTRVSALWRPPAAARRRIWHARRNTEMLAGLVLRSLLRAPLDLVFTSASQRRHTRWTKFLIRRMDAVVATSDKTAAYLEVPCRVIRHGIDTARFTPPRSREEARAELGLDTRLRYVGCFGRIRRQKGTDLFVESMITLLPENPGWGAIVAGRATASHRDFLNRLRERVDDAGLADRILFVGEHRDIERWYRALALFVAPQRWEGFGLTPLEAMASGVPVVAADVGAFAELVVDRETGRIVRPDDLGAMISAIAEHFSDDGLLARRAIASLDRARSRFPIEREADELEALYRALQRGNALPAPPSNASERNPRA